MCQVCKLDCNFLYKFLFFFCFLCRSVFGSSVGPNKILRLQNLVCYEGIKKKQKQNQQQLPQSQQPQQLPKLRVSNDEINLKFCLSWLKTTYNLMKGSRIEKQEMFKQYLFSLNNLGIGSVISEQNFATCVRTLFGESVGPNKKQMPDDTVQFFYNGIQKRNGRSTAERTECPKCGQYKSKSNMSKHIRICLAEFSVSKVENRNKRQLPDNSIDGKSKFDDQNKDKILKIAKSLFKTPDFKKSKFLYSKEIVTVSSENSNMDDLISQKSSSTFDEAHSVLKKTKENETCYPNLKSTLEQGNQNFIPANKQKRITCLKKNDCGYCYYCQNKKLGQKCLYQ